MVAERLSISVFFLHEVHFTFNRHIRIDHHDVDTHPDMVVETPIFSWSIDDEMSSCTGTLLRGIHQIAYQLIVTQELGYYSSTPTSLFIYDSGRVISNVSTNILYQGPPLISDTRYQYSIQYWSSTGAISELVTAHFRTPLFNPTKELTARRAICDCVYEWDGLRGSVCEWHQC